MNKKEKRQHKKFRRRVRWKMKEIQRRINNLRTDAHNKIATKLCQKYDHILISRYQVHDMVEKNTRVLNKRGVKEMLLMGHYQFRQILKHRGQLLGCAIHEVGGEYFYLIFLVQTLKQDIEHYSSKACGHCLILDRNLGSKKKYQCPRCHFTIPRDFNGAR